MKKSLTVLLMLALAFTMSFACVGMAYAEEEKAEPAVLTLDGAPLEIEGDADANGEAVKVEPNDPVEDPKEVPADDILLIATAEAGGGAALQDPITMSIPEVKEALAAAEITISSKLVKKGSKPAIQLTFKVDSGVKLDGIKVYRSTKKSSGYGKTAYFTTTKASYINSDVKTGKRYYYKVRGFVKMDGKTFYTDYSNKANRMVKKTSSKASAVKPLYDPSEMDGAWEKAENPEITDAVKAVFDKAFEGMNGAVYKPVSLLATQVVAGTNYLLLANGTPVFPSAKTARKLITIYEDLGGNCTITEIKDYDEAEAEEPAIVGGWQPAADPAITEELQAIFDKAAKDYAGMGFELISLVETQVVAGMNYRFLANGTAVVPGAKAAKKLVTVYKDLNGNCSITEVKDYE